ncbi:MAG: polysaccharide deacetylase family protein [Vicinamibacterales bacterium]
MSPYPLMYHDIVAEGRDDASGFAGAAAGRYKLTLEQFDDHLRAIAQSVETPPSLTFDDGGASAMCVADKLERAGWRGLFFVTTAYIGRVGFLTRRQLLDLRHRGHTIGSHSWSHPAGMSRLSSAELGVEWQRSVDELAATLGEGILTASVPGGSYSRRVGDTVAAAGVRVLFTSRPTGRHVRHGTLTVVGRYAVRRGTGAHRAAAVAAGSVLPRIGQLVWWDAKTAVKSIAASLGVRSGRIPPPQGRSAPA